MSSTDTDAAPADLLDEEGTQLRAMTNLERQHAFQLRGKHPDWSDADVARELQRRSRMSYRENRSVAQAERKAEFEAVVERVSDRLAETSSDPNFGRREVSTLCKRVVNQMADLIDSQQLVPTTAKEAAEIAKVFANIAQQDRVAKATAKALSMGSIDASSSEALPADQAKLLELVGRARATVASAVIPGRATQVGDVEDDL